MTAREYAKNVIAALDLDKAMGNDGSQVIADALVLFATSNPNVRITRKINTDLLTDFQKRIDKYPSVCIHSTKGLNEVLSEVDIEGKLNELILLNYFQ